MTKYFKKIKNFETKRFMENFEIELLKDEGVEMVKNTDFENHCRCDNYSDEDLKFMCLHFEA